VVQLALVPKQQQRAESKMSPLDIKESHAAGIEDTKKNGLVSSKGPNSSDRSNPDTEIVLSARRKRIPALDFTRGTLVLIMVLYHWLNYFVTADGTVYKYLRFLTPSFIFITGFLISHLYLPKYQASGLGISKRLLLRGVKLLAIVLCLNIALSTLHLKGFETRVGGWSLGKIVAAYLTGTASVAFSVLVPIAYLLILSAGLLIASRQYRNIYLVACALCVGCSLFLEWKGIKSGYLQIFSIGMLGVSVGYIPIERINRVVKRPLLIFLAYFTYLSAITLWDDTYPLQVWGVCVSLAVIYWIGLEEANASRMRKVAILLGRYSLFAYIAQIVILQILRSSLRPLGHGMGVAIAAFVMCVVCTILSVEVLDRARARMSGLNKVYSAVFG